MSKQVYTWGKVTAGDIVSFRYKGKQPTSKLTTLLVLNPKMPYKKKDGSKTFHLIGLKLEEKGIIPTIKAKPMFAQLLEKVGDIQVVSGEDEIYRVEIKGAGPRGVKRATYNKIKRAVIKHSVYRTYLYKEARKSAVFLEPVVLSNEFRKMIKSRQLRKIFEKHEPGSGPKLSF